MKGDVGREEGRGGGRGRGRGVRQNNYTEGEDKTASFAAQHHGNSLTRT